MTDGAMIVRLSDPECFGNAVPVPRGARSIVMARVGERVVFGTSEVGGVWTLIGEGDLVDVTGRGQDAVMIFNRCARYPSQIIDVVGIGDPRAPADAVFALDELTGAHLEQVRLRGFAVPERAGAGLRLAENEGLYASLAPDPGNAVYSWVGKGMPPDAALSDEALRHYDGKCALSAMPMCVLEGGRREGWVIPIFGDSDKAPTTVSMVIPVTASMAILYAHGLLAITEQLTVWMHPTALPEEISWSLRRINPGLRLHLPQDPAAWPDAALPRRHLEAAQG